MPFDLKEDFVVQTEAKLGAQLPDSYRRAMMAANGGEVSTEDDDWYLYPILDDSDKKRLTRTCNDVVSETASCSKWRRFPTQALAIANNGSGDRLVILRDGNEYAPTIYVWFHETGELERVADDFAELARL
ncbi:MAG: SMI1/KNR4 family protein [Bacillota bacterium]